MVEVSLPTTFILRYVAPADEVRKITVVFNGDTAKYFAHSQQSIKYTLYPEAHSVGEYELKIYVSFKTNTGSLMDKIDIEGNTVSYKWKVIIKNFSPQYPEIISFEPYEGRGRLVWKKYRNSGFIKYKIIKDGTFIEEIKNVNDTVLIDNSIIAGKHQYQLVYYGLDDQENMYSSASEIFTVNYPLIITIKHINSGNYNCSWDKPVFYNNIKSYQLEFYSYNKGQVRLAEINNPDICSYDLELGLFKSIRLILQIKPVAFNFGNPFATESKTQLSEKTFPEFPSSYNLAHSYNYENMLYFIDYSNNLNCYNINTNENLIYKNNIFYKNLRLSVSENNDHLVFYNSNGTMYISNPPEYDNFKPVKIDTLFNYSSTMCADITDDGVLFLLYKSKTSKFYLAVLNPYSGNVLSVDSVPAFSLVFASGDGNTCILTSESTSSAIVYSLKEAGIKQTMALSGFGSFRNIRYMPGSNKIAMLSGKGLEIWDCMNSMLITTYITDARTIEDIEYQNNYTLLSNQERLTILELNSGKIIKTFFTDLTDLSFLNSTIITSGVMAKIKY